MHNFSEVTEIEKASLDQFERFISMSKKVKPDVNGDWKVYNDYLKRCNERIQDACDRLHQQGLKATMPFGTETVTKAPRYGSESSLYRYAVEPGEQFTLDDWNKRVSRNFVPNDGDCLHEWTLYQGLLHDDYYCTKCNKTKPLQKK